MATNVLAPPVRAETAPSGAPLRRVATADLQQVLRSLAEAIAEVPPQDPRWRVVGPLVSAVAERVREAAGLATSPGTLQPAPIVRERELSVARRRLAARNRVVDEAAAADAIALASEVALALR